jgi:hypothetical protein
MTRDPIVEDVRAFRDELAREHDYDIDAIFEALRKMEDASGRDHVSFPPRSAAQPGAAPDGRRAGGG